VPRICFNLALDAATERGIQALRTQVAQGGITPPTSTSSTYRPHITLAVYDVDDLTRYEEVLAPVAALFAPFPIRLDSFGIFPEEGVLFLAPRMSHTLFALHDHVLQAFASLSSADRPPALSDDWLLPDQWVPHVTLAGKLAARQVVLGLEVCLHQWTARQGTATAIGLRIFPEAADYRRYPFSASLRT